MIEMVNEIKYGFFDMTHKTDKLLSQTHQEKREGPNK